MSHVPTTMWYSIRLALRFGRRPELHSAPLRWPHSAFTLGRLFARASQSLQFVPLRGVSITWKRQARRLCRAGHWTWENTSQCAKRRIMASPDDHLQPSLPALPPALRRKPAGCLLDDGSERKQRFFIKRSPDQLETERQTLGIERAGNRNAGKSSHVDRHRENVV
jgi:hypothetical protein